MKTRIAQIIAAIVLSPLVFVALLTFAVGGDAGKMAKVIRVIGGIEQPSTGRPCSSTKGIAMTEAEYWSASPSFELPQQLARAGGKGGTIKRRPRFARSKRNPGRLPRQMEPAEGSEIWLNVPLISVVPAACVRCRCADPPTPSARPPHRRRQRAAARRAHARHRGGIASTRPW
jgi:hypothetical protein